MGGGGREGGWVGEGREGGRGEGGREGGWEEGGREGGREGEGKGGRGGWMEVVGTRDQGKGGDELEPLLLFQTTHYLFITYLWGCRAFL